MAQCQIKCGPITPSLPKSNQDLSPLGRLPPELRNVVLRDLLFCDQPISNRRTDLLREVPWLRPSYSLLGAKRIKRSIRKTFRSKLLNAAILATCQQFLSEGWGILYGTNTLVIHLEAVDKSTGVYRHHNRLCARIPAYRDRVLLKTLHESNEWKFRQHAKSFAQQFQNFQIDLHARECVRSMEVMGIVKSLEKLLSGKKVQVRVDDAGYFQGDFHIYRSMNAFQLLRCPKFSILGLAKLDFAKIEGIVKSDVPVVDLISAFRLLEPLSDRLYAVLDDSKRWAECGWVEDQEKKLEDAVCDFDVDTFVQVRLTLLQKYAEFSKLEAEALINDKSLEAPLAAYNEFNALWVEEHI